VHYQANYFARSPAVRESQVLFVGGDHAHAAAEPMRARLNRVAWCLDVAGAQGVGGVGDHLLAALVHLGSLAVLLLLLAVLVKNVALEHYPLLMNTVALTSEDVSDLVAVVFSMSRKALRVVVLLRYVGNPGFQPLAYGLDRAHVEAGQHLVDLAAADRTSSLRQAHLVLKEAISLFQHSPGYRDTGEEGGYGRVLCNLVHNE